MDLSKISNLYVFDVRLVILASNMFILQNLHSTNNRQQLDIAHFFFVQTGNL